MKNNQSNKQRLGNYCESLPEFDQHNSVLFIYNKKTHLRGFIAFHRNGFHIPSFGATRFMEYENETEALRDALRLSRLMSYKNALAGLPYGGAKAVLIKPKGKFNKTAILNEYVKFINRLHGSFMTGTDMGLDLKDLKMMAKKSRNFVGLVNNPEKATALGMFFGLKPVAKKIFNKNDIKGLSFAIQGVGKVGAEFLGLVYPYASKIFISETDQTQLKKIKKKFPKAVVVPANKIYSQDVDIFSPCAVPHILNSKTINHIKAKVILGSANNQLKSLDVGETLHKLGIFYCPDYIVNAGGLIAVTDEFEFKNPSLVRLEKKLRGVGTRLEKVIETSRSTKKAPAKVAEEMARKVLKVV